MARQKTNKTTAKPNPKQIKTTNQTKLHRERRDGWVACGLLVEG
jgi:hypothetical protein